MGKATIDDVRTLEQLNHDHVRAAETSPEPFQLSVPAEVLKDLRARLERVRWPDEAPDSDWQHGSSLAYMQELVAYWRERYDWRAHEARLNRWRQFTVALGGIDLHFIHEPGVGPAPLPLLLSHGGPARSWSSSAPSRC